MKLKSIIGLSLLLTCYLVSLQQVGGIETKTDQEPITLRVKRQARSRQVASVSAKQQVSLESSTNGDRQANSVALSATSGAGGRGGQISNGAANLPNSGSDVDSPAANIDGFEEQERPPAPRPAKKARKPAARPSPNRDRHDRDEDCYPDGDYYDYTNNFFQMATQPMRHFNRMMNDVFNRMPPMGNDDYERSPASVASASAFSNGDGFSRLASSVTNNGRTRGIVSETRNGRTQTRRIGREGGDDEDDGYSRETRGSLFEEEEEEE